MTQIGYISPDLYLSKKSKKKRLTPEQKIGTAQHLTDDEYNFVFHTTYEARGYLVYFIQAGDSGPVKIGISSLGTIDGRISALQTSNAEKLNVLAILLTKDSAELEQKLHECLASHRMQGEWFQPHERVLSFAKLAEAGRIDVIEALVGQFKTAEPWLNDKD